MRWAVRVAESTAPKVVFGCTCKDSQEPNEKVDERNVSLIFLFLSVTELSDAYVTVLCFVHRFINMHSFHYFLIDFRGPNRMIVSDRIARLLQPFSLSLKLHKVISIIFEFHLVVHWFQ